MADEKIDELFSKVNKLDIKCTRMETDICWIKKIMWLLILLSLSAIGVGVPQYFI